jgi:hypothetical protein
MYRRLGSVFLLAAALVPATDAATSVATDTPTPTISAIRPMPPGYSASARELSPLETGWSRTQRMVGADARIRTTIESALAGDRAVAHDGSGRLTRDAGTTWLIHR